jgi:hypothetical protein
LPTTTDYIVRWFKETDLDYYLFHLNNSLYNQYDEERFQWKFLQSPIKLDIVPIAIVEERKTGNPVGFNSFLPLEIKTSNTIIPIVQGCDGYIERDHRRKGLFQKTIHFMTDYFSDNGPELLLGYNFVESLGAAQKAGSISTFLINRWFFKLNQIEIDLNPVSDLSLTRTNHRRAYDIYRFNLNDQVIHLHRTQEYLDWRFNKSPLRDYILFEYQTGDLIGYIVVSRIENEEGKIELSIDDYFPVFTDANQFFMILHSILKEFQDIDVIELYTRNNDVLDRALINFGLNKDQEPRYTLIMKPIKKADSVGKILMDGVNLIDNEKWHITKSDIY